MGVQLPAATRLDFSEVVPNSSYEARTLIQEMLTYDPKQRITP